MGLGLRLGRRAGRLNLIAQVEISVRQLERAIAFYSAVFNVDFGEIVEIHGNRMAYFRFTAGEDGASGALVEGEIYVPTSLGSSILVPKSAISDTAFVAEIVDGEGNRIALQTV